MNIGKLRTLFWVLPLALALALGARDASAAPTKCSEAPPLNTSSDGIISTDQMTFRGNNADDCYGLADGNTPDNINFITWGDFELVVKSDDPFPQQAEFDGIQWSLLADEAGSGNWTLFFEDAGKSGTYDVVAAIKAGDDWAAWLFTAEHFLADGQDSGTFQIAWCVGKGPECSTPDLSHLSVYLRIADGGGGGSPQVPAPATLALLGLGMAGLAVARKVWSARR